jgi:hypothetical protein
MAPTYPNRIYQHAAQTDRITNTLELSTLPTIWDRLAAAGLDGRYYYSDVPFLALWGAKYLPIASTFSDFLADAAAGTLPHVSFVEPRFLGAEFGLSGGRPPVCRHPERPGVSQPCLSCGDHEPGLVSHVARLQLRRVGRLLRSRAAADGADS